VVSAAVAEDLGAGARRAGGEANVMWRLRLQALSAGCRINRKEH